MLKESMMSPHPHASYRVPNGLKVGANFNSTILVNRENTYKKIIMGLFYSKKEKVRVKLVKSDTANIKTKTKDLKRRGLGEERGRTEYCRILQISKFREKNPCLISIRKLHYYYR